MKRQPVITQYYTYQQEEMLNPYIGFTSFQHFRGEKLYSDIVVKPESLMTETERVECYPVSADAEENGREEGYYPDTTVAYIRVLWKEFEPEQGKFNYEFIEDILKKAKDHGQTLIFRLMAHSTRACDDVPEWLKKLIECPERPPMKRVKDSPTSPEFLDLFLNAVRKFGERFDSDITLDAIDISLPGAWGEGHKLELYPENTCESILETYLDVFKQTNLITQIARPDLLNLAEKHGVHIGCRGDGMGEPYHLDVAYPPRIALIGDRWMKAPVSFESFWWIGEWFRKGWDIDNIIAKTLEWHISTFNAKSLPIPYEWKDKIDAWVRKMGYHFVIDSFSYPDCAAASDSLLFRLNIENVGVAPIYKKLPLMLRLADNNHCYMFDTGIDITKWMPGKSTSDFEIRLPTDIPTGNYSVEIAIVSPHVPFICFATDAKRNDAYYKVGALTIK